VESFEEVRKRITGAPEAPDMDEIQAEVREVRRVRANLLDVPLNPDDPGVQEYNRRVETHGTFAAPKTKRKGAP
jgi:hypothetical protein